jgi:competence protein ComEC
MQSWMIGLVTGIIGIGFSAQLPAWPAATAFAAIVLAALSFTTRTLRRSTAMRFIGGLSCGCAVGIAHGNLLLHSRLAQECVGESIIVTGEVSSLPSANIVQGRLRQRFEFSLASLSPQRCAGPRRLMLSYYGDDTIHPGAHWQFEVKLKRPWGLANPGSFNMQAWFAQYAIDAVGNVRESQRTHVLPGRWSLRFLPDQMRQAISDRINAQSLDRDIAAMLRALTVADGAGIDAKLWFLFQQYGLNHLLVISGSHVVMIAAIGYLFGGLCLRIAPAIARSWLPGVAALLLASLYTALAGFSIPTQRALCMLACFVFANVAGRTNNVVHNLLVAAVIVLLLNPLAALSSGFWLSFGAVVALLWITFWQRGASRHGQLLWTHGGISLVMMPLGAYLFGGGSVIAMLANLLMIPLTGWWVVPIALLASLCFLCGWTIDTTLWRLAAAPLDALLPLARALALSSGEWLYMPMAAGLGAMLLAVVAVFLILLPGRPIVTPLALLLALPLLLPQDLSIAPPSLHTLVTVLDVGQGTAVVVQAGDRALLYDTGGGDPEGLNMGIRAVLPYLRLRGIRSLDTLVISHPDLDHSAGAATVLDNMQVGRLRYGRTSPAAGKGRACVAGEAWQWPGGQTFQFLSPALEIPRHSNDSSCVLRIQVGDYSFLLPGDIEHQREHDLVAYWGRGLHSDWLLAAHHGSRTSSSFTFLKTVQPDVAVISSGYANPFGHPHPDILQRLQRQGIDMFSTVADGAVEFELRPGKPLHTTSYRQQVRYYWM